MIEMRGHSGTVQFDGEMLTITRTGLGRLTVGKGDRQIPVESITAVQWKPAGLLVNGFIQFGVKGSVEGRSRAGRQTHDAGRDENAVVFTRAQQQDFERLRDAVSGAIHARATQSAAGRQATPSVAGEIAALSDLVRSGELTQEKFERQKARLLG